MRGACESSYLRHLRENLSDEANTELGYYFYHCDAIYTSYKEISNNLRFFGGILNFYWIPKWISENVSYCNFERMQDASNLLKLKEKRVYFGGAYLEKVGIFNKIVRCNI